MKIKIMLGLLAVLLVSCGQPTIIPTQTTFTYGGANKILEVYTIDGCQYLGYLHGSDTDILCHKGNCPNPIHYPTYSDTIFYQKVIKP